MDESTSAGNASLPPPPTSGAAPGQAGFENGTASHMPPPLNIPQNNGALPTELGDFISPTSGVRRMAPEPNKRALYVGGLDPRVTEDVLKQIFETTGHVQNVKIIPDKNVSLHPSLVSAYTRRERDNICVA
jgi:nucleolysin TIA-1/TIAR